MRDEPPGLRWPSRWPSIALDSGLTVRVAGHMPDLPAPVAAEVEAIWRERQAANPALFNGRVFTADRLTARGIVGHWTTYQRVLAQMTRPTLYPALRLKPLAVTGILHAPDGIVLGRRAPHSTYLAGWWQTPPAGSVESRHGENKVDLTAQILAEAQEELGLAPDMLTVAGPVRATRHPATRIVDIGIRLDTALPFDRVLQGWHAGGNDEYDRLAIVKPNQNPEDVVGPHILPGTREYLDVDRRS
ncbi:NUDIX domain-containing protein [Gluconacetobacter diazotrophicus]|uniref:NUDIX domain-containing protein n=1 Tax=Gluconacetobacter diazotrophicus TaxID=33996 RepID=UPI00217F592F|nr:NUDIX domain-containing protein [Gluconacetobacter diazotrophicus]